jgi:hypothetical protein
MGPSAWVFVRMSLEDLFPLLQGKSFTVTSNANADYNCVAWAIGQTQGWWWPSDDEGAVWPAGVALEESLDAFRAMFGHLGFAPCSDTGIEPDFERIAVFANASMQPQHVARQLPNGRWTSKLGKLEDIEHDLHDL